MSEGGLLPSCQSEAKRLGCVYYYTGKPCKHGHVDVRTTRNGTCYVCAQQKSARWQSANKHAARDKCHRWRVNNPHSAKKSDDERRRRRRGKHMHECREWRKRNRNWVLDYGRINAKNHYARKPWVYKVNAAARRARMKEREPLWINRDAIQTVYVKAQRLTEETGIEHHVDHIYPLQGRNVSGLHVADNLRVVPATVNLSKSNKYPEEVET